MSREERMELMTAVVAKLEEVAQLLIKAEEAAKDAAAVQKSPLAD
jgi:hypothetical protein